MGACDFFWNESSLAPSRGRTANIRLETVNDVTTSTRTSEVKVQTGDVNIPAPSLLSMVECSLLAVIKVFFPGLQMVKIAQKTIAVHVRRCTIT